MPDCPRTPASIWPPLCPPMLSKSRTPSRLARSFSSKKAPASAGTEGMRPSWPGAGATECEMRLWPLPPRGAPVRGGPTPPRGELRSGPRSLSTGSISAGSMTACEGKVAAMSGARSQQNTEETFDVGDGLEGRECGGASGPGLRGADAGFRSRRRSCAPSWYLHSSWERRGGSGRARMVSGMGAGGAGGARRWSNHGSPRPSACAKGRRGGTRLVHHGRRIRASHSPLLP